MHFLMIIMYLFIISTKLYIYILSEISQQHLVESVKSSDLDVPEYQASDLQLWSM